MTDPIRDELVPWAVGRLPTLAVDAVDPVEYRAVVRLVDAEGRAWYAKRLVVAENWHSEVRVYTRWAPHLIDGCMPTLVAWDEPLQALLLTELPGVVPRPLRPRSHRSAGRLLRTLHDRVPVGDDVRPVHADENVPELLERHADVLTSDQVDFVRSAVERLDEPPEGAIVACHGDFVPKNWIDIGDGVLGMFDFAHSGQGAPAVDLAQLVAGPWWDRPGLVRAFLRGYGRALTADEKEYLGRAAAPQLIRRIAAATGRNNVAAMIENTARLQSMVDGFRPELPDPD